MHERDYESRIGKKRGCVGCLGRLIGRLLVLLLIVIIGGLLSFIAFPPFGTDRTARLLLLGLDGSAKDKNDRRSDTIILCAARLDGSGTTLLSIPRDAAIRHRRIRGTDKINAVYAYGKVPLLQDVLADPKIMNATMPYYLVIDSDTTRAIVDAVGGVWVDVPHAMDYDDNWANLHIHLKPGHQRLNGKQVVGYLRWRKNTHGGRSDTDFSRNKRQREVLIAIANELRSVSGVLKAPAVYRAFRAHTTSNLSFRQLAMIAWSARKVESDAVPAVPYRSGRISYVRCDWAAGREKWQNAVR
ncbi:MAG: LCP family protein [Armatimonadota bacterium]